jgi:hypothetical protein
MTDLLAERFRRLTNPVDDSDWLAVRRRAGRRRRRAALAVVAVAAAVVLVTPAFGIGGRLLDLVQGSPAPPEVQTYFAGHDETRRKLYAHAAAAGHALHERFSPVVAGEARGIVAIESADGPIYLWAAPTEDGRQCWLIQAGAASGLPSGLGSCDEADAPTGITPGLFWTDQRPSVRIVHARIHDGAIARVDLEVEGEPDRSLPVLSGHVLATVPKDAHVEALVGRSADGDVVERFQLG